MSSPGYFNHPRPELVCYLPANAVRVLDVGCGEGTFSVGLKEKQKLETWGMEIDEESASIAATRLDQVLTGDAVLLAAELPDAYFDCIFCNDILEHLVDPDKLLNILKTKLAPGGRLVTSVPNVRHFWTVWDLFFRGRWDYSDEGILDRTHLRFFTKSTMGELFADCGYRVESVVGLHPIGSIKFKLFNLLTLGIFREMRFLQYAWVLVNDK
ncbi:MAG: class I SAM-dependent methyltransferase [bacterium]|nr:class I SAM-dependent methyltransferase [bacterium]MCP4801058.1 class I SAM-dependent methyltransferase [bacterium]